MADLSREDKLQRIALLEEKRRRDLLKKPPYQPHKGQLEVHNSTSNIRFVFSGNGSGKTALLVNEVHWALTGYNPITKKRTPVPARVALVVDNSSKIETVFLKEYRKWHELKDDNLKKDGKPHVSRIIYDNGSVLNIYTAEMDAMVLEGIELHFVAIDEPIPRNLYVALRRSLRLKGMQNMLFSGTAISHSWLRSDIFTPWSKGELPDTECFRVGTAVNAQNLPEGYLETFGRTLTQEEKEVRLLGGFFDAGSLALAHLWRRESHIIKTDDLHWDDRNPVVVGIDPHYRKPHTAIMVGADRDSRQVVLKELCIKATAKEFGLELIKWMAGYRVIEIVCDSLGATEGTGNDGFSTFIEQVNKVLEQHSGRLRVRSTRYEDKSAEDLIDRLQTGLLIPNVPDNFGKNIPKLRVMSTCRGLIENIESVGWQRNKADGTSKPKLDTSTKDFLSACGYALACNIHFNRGREKVIRKEKPPYRGLSLPSLRRQSGR